MLAGFQNTNYNYAKEAYALIPIIYDDAAKTLVIDTRKGQFDGMAAKRTFNIVLVTSLKPGKLNFDGSPDNVVTYVGTEQKIDLSKF